MKLLVSALEPSANVHLKYLMEKLPDVEIAGIFDRALGTPLYGMDEFSVMGFVDVLAKYFKGKEAVAEMTQLAGECDKVLLIDAPAFNLPLAKAIRERYPKKEIVYYILPKVWAWKKGRAKKVDRYCDRLASIFPFEKRFYPRAEYVGNPLLDEITLTWRPTEDAETIAFLPGSRKSEITRLMPVFKEVAEALPGRRKVLSIPDFISDEKIAEWYGDISGFDVVRDAQHADGPDRHPFRAGLQGPPPGLDHRQRHRQAPLQGAGQYHHGFRRPGAGPSRNFPERRDEREAPGTVRNEREAPGTVRNDGSGSFCRRKSGTSRNFAVWKCRKYGTADPEPGIINKKNLESL